MSLHATHRDAGQVTVVDVKSGRPGCLGTQRFAAKDDRVGDCGEDQRKIDSLNLAAWTTRKLGESARWSAAYTAGEESDAGN